MREVFKALRELRLIVGVSQEHLSEKIGCSRISLTSYENTQSRPKRPILEKWLLALSEEILLYDATHRAKAREFSKTKAVNGTKSRRKVKGNED